MSKSNYCRTWTKLKINLFKSPILHFKLNLTCTEQTLLHTFRIFNIKFWMKIWFAIYNTTKAFKIDFRSKIIIFNLFLMTCHFIISSISFAYIQRKSKEFFKNEFLNQKKNNKKIKIMTNCWSFELSFVDLLNVVIKFISLMR